MRKRFRSGALVELMIDADSIPAGHYRFQEQHGEMLIFRVAPEILFGINATYWGSFTRQVFDSTVDKTSARDFVNQYRKNIEEARLTNSPFCPDKFTFCILGKRGKSHADRFRLIRSL
jgi:hypothetical protein